MKTLRKESQTYFYKELCVLKKQIVLYQKYMPQLLAPLHFLAYIVKLPFAN